MLKFVDPSAVVAELGLKSGDIVADLGCGAGFYSVGAGRVVGSSGMVYAVDVQEAKLAATQSNAKQHNLKNIMAVKADLEKPLLTIGESSCDAVIVASILHEIGSRDALMKNAYRLLKTGGQLLAVEWKKQMTPFGPPLENRLAPEKLREMLTALGMRPAREIPADSYHYAIVFVK